MDLCSNSYAVRLLSYLHCNISSMVPLGQRCRRVRCWCHTSPVLSHHFTGGNPERDFCLHCERGEALCPKTPQTWSQDAEKFRYEKNREAKQGGGRRGRDENAVKAAPWGRVHHHRAFHSRFACWCAEGECGAGFFWASKRAARSTKARYSDELRALSLSWVPIMASQRAWCSGDSMSILRISSLDSRLAEATGRIDGRVMGDAAVRTGGEGGDWPWGRVMDVRRTLTMGEGRLGVTSMVVCANVLGTKIGQTADGEDEAERSRGTGTSDEEIVL